MYDLYSNAYILYTRTSSAYSIRRSAGCVPTSSDVSSFDGTSAKRPRNSAHPSHIPLTTHSLKTSKVKRPASMETERIVIPRVPQEVVDEILDHLTTDPDHRSLQSSALVSKSWVPSCRRHLFHTTIFTPKNAARWVKTFPVPERSPACYVRDLRFLAEGSDTIFELKFFEHVPWFTNAEKMSLSGDGHLRLMRFPLSCGLPQSVASLTIDGGAVFLGHIRGIMAQLPNLNDLSLAGNIVPGDRRALLGIGKVLRGRFGGKLRLHRGRSYEDTVNMMLEIPTGLHFTEVEIRAKYGCPSAMRLAEACSKTLTRLTYTADFNCKFHPF